VSYRGETKTYAVISQNVASSAAAGKAAKVPYVAWVSGDKVTFALDDTSGFSTLTPDFDYNDRYVDVRVTPNRPPTAANDSTTTSADTPVTIAVLANDSDPDGDAMAPDVSAPGHGTAVSNPDGTVTYTPASGFVGDDSFTYRAVDAYGMASAPATVNVSVKHKVLIRFTNKDGETIPPNPTLTGPRLKVAKWENSFEEYFDQPTLTEKVRVKAPNGDGTDFIDWDPDRFTVRVFDSAAAAAGKATIDVTLATTNVNGFTAYNDGATKLTLVKMPAGSPGEYGNAGWYWSDSQILVSNQVDDEFTAPYLQADDTDPAPGPLANHKNGSSFPISDRTHRIALRGSVTVKYNDGTKEYTETSKVLAKNTVKVHVSILRPTVGGKPVATETEANEWVHAANEQYA
jgi:hypothetical protein